jgi:hypothetical protein
VGRAGRDAFKATLRKHAEQSIIQAKSRWQRYREVVRKEPEYLSLAANTTGSRPKELFLDEVQALVEAFSKDKATLKRVLAEYEFVITVETEWEDFLAFLQTHDVGCAPAVWWAIKAVWRCRACYLHPECIQTHLLPGSDKSCFTLPAQNTPYSVLHKIDAKAYMTCQQCVRELLVLSPCFVSSEARQWSCERSNLHRLTNSSNHQILSQAINASTTAGRYVARRKAVSSVVSSIFFVQDGRMTGPRAVVASI